jgi:hypothetical protein
LIVGDRELFVTFRDFPWFKDASIAALTNVELPSPHHLYWPDLDVDLAVESIEHPEKFPLVSRVGTSQRSKRPGTAPSARRGRKTPRKRGRG